MIFFFGTRATKIKERQLKKTTCTYCNTQNSFWVATYSKYFHIFWIPIIPLFKREVAECFHCKKSYASSEFTPEMRSSLEEINRTNPAKRPIWQGCGCLILSVLLLLFLCVFLYGGYLKYTGKAVDQDHTDYRAQLLEEDTENLIAIPHHQKDSLSFLLKYCFDRAITGFETEDIAYFTKIKENKLLVLLHVENTGDLEASNRKVILEVIESCLNANDDLDRIEEFYIGVEGKYNTVLVKTPTDADVGGRFANKKKLLPFYGPKEMASDTLTIKIDTIRQSPH